MNKPTKIRLITGMPSRIAAEATFNFDLRDDEIQEIQTLIQDIYNRHYDENMLWKYV